MYSKWMFLGTLMVSGLLFVFRKDSKILIHSTDIAGITYFVDQNSSSCLTCNSNLRSKQMMPGTTWVDPFNNLRDALAIAVAGDTIKVAQGTYYPDEGTGAINNDRNSTFSIPSGVVLIGGYPTGGAAESKPDCYKTILSGDIDGDQTFAGNSYHVVTTIGVSPSTLIDGFCITGGNADNPGGDGFVKYGGGWLNRSNNGIESSPTISNCNFYSNQTGQTNNNFGGGAFASFATAGNTFPKIINTTMQGNLALRGGAIRTYSLGPDSACVLTMTNCLITGNKATENATDQNADRGRGGAIYNDGIGTVLNMINCVLSGNNCNSNRQGGALYNANFGSIKPLSNLTNCIIWNNVAGTGENNFYLNPGPGDSVKVSYSIIGPTNNLNPGTGSFKNVIGNKIGVDPLFVFAPLASVAPTTTGDFHVQSGSPAIDMGDNAASTYPVDLDGNSRVFNTIIDIGSYEYFMDIECAILGSVIYVDSAATSGLNNGSSWANAFTDLQDALKAVTVCGIDTVKVAQGTYYPSDTVFVYDKCTGILTNTILPDKNISFNIPDSAVLLGGYGHGADSFTRDWECNKTVLCGDIDHNGILDLGNSIHVVTTVNVDSATIVDGFCITMGNASESYFNDQLPNNNYPDFVGGGWFDDGSGDDNGSFPTIINCNISGNRANGGGGLFCDGRFGGNSSPKLINCILSGNLGFANGGAIFSDGNLGTSSPKLINCVVAGNLAYFFDGAAMYNSGLNAGICTPYIVNSIFWNNRAYQSGGTANSNVFHNYDAHPYVANCIVQGSSLNDGATVTTVTGSGLNTDGGNNKFTDPLFINSPILVDDAATKAGNFNLLPGSPAIDMGLNGINNYPADYATNPRVVNGTIDIGVYESTDTSDCALYSTVVYVDSAAAGANNGTTWADAFTDLQDALAVIRSCDVDTIKVAQGTYYPSKQFVLYDRCTGEPVYSVDPDRTASFAIPDSTVMIGGYPTGGSDLAEGKCNPTILSGDIQQDGDLQNNSYHVVTTFGVSDKTCVDGFCIRDGNAVYLDTDAFPTFRNVGGGWLNTAILLSQLDDMALPGVSNPKIINCTFINNHALIGGGLCNLGIFSIASPTITDCNFYSDSSILGGAIANIGVDGESSPVILRAKVQGNTGLAAGGILNLAGSIGDPPQPIAPNKGTLRSKSAMPQELHDAFEKSGLMSLIHSMEGRMTHATNTQIPDGTAASVFPAEFPGFGVVSPMIKNSLITGNAALIGGGLINYVLNFNQLGGGEVSPKIINTSIASNAGYIFGGGMVNGDEGFVNDGQNLVQVCIVNSILWDNVADQDNDMFNIFNGNAPYADTIKLHHSIVQSDFATLTNNVSAPHTIDTTLGGNKYQTDPLFISSPGGISAATLAGDFHLQKTSPAINMGDNASCLDSIDLDHKPRVFQAIIDIGPYENILDCDSLTIYVNANGTIDLIPIDSLVATVTAPCEFLINGEVNTTGIQLTCDNLGVNTFTLEVTKPVCDDIQTLVSCDKIITVLDTFPKALVGSDEVNVSLDQNCMKLISPDDVLKNVLGCRNAFEVTLSYPFGTNTYTPANKIDRSHLGYCMVYTVTEVATGNKTWGKLCVEDKAPPFIDCRADTVTCFQIAQLPQGSYTINDNCDNPVKVHIASEQYFDYGCDSAIQGRVFRRLIAKDTWGNSIDCNKEYVIKRIELDSVICPRDTSVDCALATIKIDTKNVHILDPKRSGAPKVWANGELVSLIGANASCKMSVTHKDERFDICGNANTVFKIRREWLIVDWCTGEEKICVQWISVMDTTAPKPTNRIMPTVAANAHECGAYITLDTLKVEDCSKVEQAYNLVYTRDGKEYVEQGRLLPNTRIWVPTGRYRINVLLADDCKNNSKGYIDVSIEDNTPPTPICDEFTQVTVDPEGCWAKVAAKDLDNGSRDNCCDVLHFAAAKMSDIEYWRKYWTSRLETEAGKADFWKNKAQYDEYIESWINCYIFSDTVHFDECGTNQVVLRVYEACGVPRYDPHIFPCSPHAWFCYNTYFYLADFNYNWFDNKGQKSCSYRPDLTTFDKQDSIYKTYDLKGYFNPKFAGAAQYFYCDVPFYFPLLSNNYSDQAPGTYCSERLYNDCMVNVLVDDKQAPTVYGLEDITIYCDGAPGWADYADCGYGDRYTSSTWPGELKDKKGIIHGYYGGSDYLGIHVNESDHNDPEACQASKGWAPIYCKDWLYLDSFPVPMGDQAGHVEYASYFDKVVLFDKTRAKRELKGNEFSFYDNCRLDDASLVVTNAGTVNGCGEGWISRTWTIKDKCGNSVSATQKILVKHRSDFEVIFPEDKVVTCDFFNRTDTSALGAGKPYISDDECEQVGVQYKDEIFEIEDSACYKIVRTWTLVDWCIYVPEAPNRYPDIIVNDSLRANKSDRSCVYRNIKDNGDGYMKYVQIIKVIDENAPQFTCTDNTTCITAGCDATVNIPLSASDNCTDANDIKIRAEITKPDATVERRNDIKAITGKFTAGVYTIKLTANDRCGNETTCTMTLTVKDCKKPTPYCIDGIATVVMPSTGSVEIWAKDFDRGAEDNCPGALTYSFTTDKTKASRVITCADIPNGREALLQVSIYVTDAADNQDFCKVSLKVQDNSSTEFPGGACKDTNALVANITGKLQTEENEGVENARVEIKSTISPSVTYMSKVDGSYAFNDMSMTGNYTIKALRDDEPMNGVSTLDLVNIQNHVLGTEILKSPYKMIAADVNNDKDITAVDLLELRKLILGIYDKLPDNTSWKFVPKSYVFSDVNNPWSYPTEEALTEMSQNIPTHTGTGQVTKDFIGIKVGDVNASAVPHSLMGTEIRSTETGLILEVEDRMFKAGENVKVEFKSPNFAGVSGFQGTMSMYDVRCTIYDVKSGAINLTDKNIGTRWANEGLITMSWNEKTGIDIEANKVLFTMNFVAKKDGRLSEVMRIGSQRTKAESYEGVGELGNLSIRFVDKSGQEVSGRNTLYQNYPNPFDQRTVIGINLAQSTEGTLKVTDVAGRVIKSFNREWNKGYNEVWLDRRDVKTTGVLFYTFESKLYTASKRMVILE